jgi:hypothetical protein
VRKTAVLPINYGREEERQDNPLRRTADRPWSLMNTDRFDANSLVVTDRGAADFSSANVDDDSPAARPCPQHPTLAKHVA